MARGPAVLELVAAVVLAENGVGPGPQVGQLHVRARTILTGFTAVFARCGLVLMGGQSRQAVAAELVLVVAGD